MASPPAVPPHAGLPHEVERRAVHIAGRDADERPEGEGAAEADARHGVGEPPEAVPVLGADDGGRQPPAATRHALRWVFAATPLLMAAGLDCSQPTLPCNSAKLWSGCAGLRRGKHCKKTELPQQQTKPNTGHSEASRQPHRGWRRHTGRRPARSRCWTGRRTQRGTPSGWSTRGARRPRPPIPLSEQRNNAGAVWTERRRTDIRFQGLPSTPMRSLYHSVHTIRNGPCRGVLDRGCQSCRVPPPPTVGLEPRTTDGRVHRLSVDSLGAPGGGEGAIISQVQSHPLTHHL